MNEAFLIAILIKMAVVLIAAWRRRPRFRAPYWYGRYARYGRYGYVRYGGYRGRWHILMYRSSRGRNLRGIGMDIGIDL